jgi:hypothetical protein
MYKSFLSGIFLLCGLSLSLAAQGSKDMKPLLYPMEMVGKWGFVNNIGRPVISPRYEAVDQKWGFYEGLIAVKKGGKWGFMNDKGVIAIKPQFDSVGHFSEGAADVMMYVDNSRTKALKGYIDKKGKFVASTNYEAGRAGDDYFSEGLCLVQKNGKFGYIDKSGELAIPCSFSNASRFQEGVATAISDSGLYGAIDTKGNWVISPFYKRMSRFYDGVAAFTKNGKKWGLMDKKGRVLLTAIYTIDTKTFAFNDGLAAIALDNKQGFVNTDGKIIVPLEYDMVQNFSEGLAAASKGGIVTSSGEIKTVDGGWGFIDKTGKTVIEHQFQSVMPFSEGMAAARKDNLWGFIDKEGNWIIQPAYKETPGPFMNGLARITERSTRNKNDSPKIGYIDKTGKLLWELQN